MKIVDSVPFNRAFLSVPVGKLKIKESEYEFPGSIRVVDQGQATVSGYTNRTDLLRQNPPYIVFGDHTRVIKFVDYPFVVGADGVRLYKAAKDYDPEFLYFYLKSIPLPVDGYGRHSKYLKEIKVPRLGKAEQHRITARLKFQMAEIEAARKALAVQLASISNLMDTGIENMLKISMLNNGENVNLGDIISITANLVNPTLSEVRDLPHVSAENIVSITGDFIGLKSAAEDGMKSNKYLFDAGDVLYSKLRPYLRKVALASFAGLCSADMYPLKTNPKLIDAEYLKVLLGSKIFTDYANEKSARSRMPKLNREQLFSWKFCLPPLKDQRECAQRVKRFIHEVTVTKAASMIMTKDMNVLSTRILYQVFEM